MQAVVGSLLGVEVTPIGTRQADEVEHGVAQFARSANGGLNSWQGNQTSPTDHRVGRSYDRLLRPQRWTGLRQ
jgi:hypothetical protein